MVMIAVHALLCAASFESDLLFPPNAFHNHGSSIVETGTGDLIAAWFHGTGERNADDVQIQGARKRAGAGEWSEPFVLADTPGLPDCNPVLFLDPRGVLWLFWITVQDNEWGGSLLKYRTAERYNEDGPPQWDWQEVIHARPLELEDRFIKVVDDGVKIYGAMLESLAPGKMEEALQIRDRAKDKLTQRLGWMTRTPPIMTDESTLMLGLYSDVFNCSLAAFTSDWGKTWSFSTPILDSEVIMLGNIQPTFAKRSNGEIAAYMRDNGLPKQVRQATSTDGGRHWSSVTYTGIPNPGSSVCACVLRNGRWALACNDTQLGRHQLTVYLSDDEGATWPISRKIEEAPFDEGNFSYPTLIQGADETLHITYSYTRKGVQGSSIKHARFTESWIRGNE